LPAIAFFHGTIKSIVSEPKFKFLSQADEEAADRADNQASVERWRDEEAAKNATEYRAEVLGCFVDDPVAQKIVIGIMEGRRGEELRAETGLSETEYDSKRRKIRRRIEKLKSD
jgi:RNA polymerase sigma-70 factor (ECF subfamily)